MIYRYIADSSPLYSQWFLKKKEEEEAASFLSWGNNRFHWTTWIKQSVIVTKWFLSRSLSLFLGTAGPCWLWWGTRCTRSAWWTRTSRTSDSSRGESLLPHAASTRGPPHKYKTSDHKGSISAHTPSKRIFVVTQSSERLISAPCWVWWTADVCLWKVKYSWHAYAYAAAILMNFPWIVHVLHGCMLFWSSFAFHSHLFAHTD